MDNEKKKYYYSKNMLFIRMLIGGYLCYVGYDLLASYLKNIEEASTSSMPIPFLIVVSIVFMVVGLVVAGLSLKGLIKGEYKDGKSDVSETQNVADVIEEKTETIVEENEE